MVKVQTKDGQRLATVIMAAEANPRATTLPKALAVVDSHSQNKHLQREAQGLAAARKSAAELEQPINIVGAELSPDRKKATFYFTSPERIDFRPLVKDLAKRLHRRIELRQIGVRDAARHTGGRGHCGRSLCCSTWLPEFKPVSIRMAKEQNLTLGSDKLSGVCGRLRCCLRYEQELYAQRRP